MSSFFDDDPVEDVTGKKVRDKKKSRSEKAKSSSLNLSFVLPAVPAIDPSKFTITTADCIAAEQRRKSAVTGNGAADSASQISLADALAASMEQAQKMRARERDEAMMRKLHKEREVDAKNPELAEKDFQVGVFITSAYRKAKQAISVESKASATRNSSRPQVGTSGGDDDDEDGVPVIEFTREKGSNFLSGSTTEYFDKLLDLQAREFASTSHADGIGQDGSAIDTQISVVDETTDHPLAVDTTPGDSPQPSTSIELKPVTTTASTKEIAEETSARYEVERATARERRSQLKWDEGILQAAANRFIMRQNERKQQFRLMVTNTAVGT